MYRTAERPKALAAAEVSGINLRDTDTRDTRGRTHVLGSLLRATPMALKPTLGF